MRRRRVIGLGQGRMEHLAIVDRFCEADTKIPMAGLSLQGGGTAQTALVTLARFGVEAAALDKLSDDDFGRFVVRGLQGAGVDVSGMVVQPGRLSPYCFVIIDRSGARQIALCTQGSVDPLRLGEMDLAPTTQASMLLLDGTHVPIAIEAAERARSAGVSVVLNADETQEGVGELLALSDVLVVSERYASDLAPRGEIDDALMELRRLGPETVVITLGQEGAIGLRGSEIVRQPAMSVEVVDTTGAGDVFLGAFCYGMIENEPLSRCLKLATVAAGLCCRAVGARAGIPNLEEVLAVV